MSKEKRIRGINFSSAECRKLYDAVSAFRSIIENKKTDKFTWVEKQKAWKDLTDFYNATTAKPRTTAQLSSKYDSLKRAVKKRNAALKQFSYGTGGGPFKPPKFEDEELLDMVESLMPVAINGMDATIDSDSYSHNLEGDDESADNDIFQAGTSGLNFKTPLAETDSVSIAEDEEREMDDLIGEHTLPVVDEEAIIDDPTDPNSLLEQRQKWVKYTPAMLKRLPHPVLTAAGKTAASKSYAARRRPTIPSIPNSKSDVASNNSKKFGGMADAKKGVAVLQQDLLQKDFDLRSRLMLAEHDIDMQIKRAKLELIQAQLKNEIAKQIV